MTCLTCLGDVRCQYLTKNALIYSANLLYQNFFFNFDKFPQVFYSKYRKFTLDVPGVKVTNHDSSHGGNTPRKLHSKANVSKNYNFQQI